MSSLLLALVLALPQPAPASAKVAMVLEVQGAVTVQTTDAAARPVKLLSMLAVADRMSVPPGATVSLLFLADNHRERVKPSSQVELTARGCLPATAVERAEPPSQRLGEIRLPVKELSGTGADGGVIFRGPPLPKAPPAVTPMFGATLSTDRPMLAWKPAAGATSYQVRLFRGRVDTLGSPDRLLWTGRTREPRLSYPADEKALHFGNLYAWEVLAETEGGGAKTLWQSQFAVGTMAEVADLARLRTLAAGKEQADWLLAALAYQAYGAHEEALGLYERLAERLPREGRFQAALAGYYHRAGRPEESTRAQERAKKLTEPSEK